MKNQLGFLYLGKDSSEFYLRKLTEFGFNDVHVISTNFPEINAQLPTNYKLLKNLLTPYLQQVEQGKISRLLVPNITLHETLDELDYSFKFKLSHPVLEGCRALKKKGVQEVFLFGSLHTMEGGYIKDYFETDDIKTLIPIEQDMQFIDQIRKKVFDGSIKDSEIEAYESLISKYHQKLPVVIACTELSVLQESIKLSNVFDLAMLQIKSSLNGVCT